MLPPGYRWGFFKNYQQIWSSRLDLGLSVTLNRFLSSYLLSFRSSLQSRPLWVTLYMGEKLYYIDLQDFCEFSVLIE